jgi:hypothetical protein
MISVLIPVSLRPTLLRHLFLTNTLARRTSRSPTGLFEAGSISPRSALLHCGRSLRSLRLNHFGEYSVQLPVIDLLGIRLTANDECADSGLFEAGSISPRTFGAAAVRFAH